MNMKNFNIINISCFGAIRPLKNHLSQALAEIQFANDRGLKLQFHINATRREQQGDNILKNLRSVFDYLPNHELIEHRWMNHDSFMQVLRSEIDLGMQVSFTETYNIVAADHVVNGIPMVTSSEVPFVLPVFHADPNSIPSMIHKLHRAWQLRFLQLHQVNRWLLKYNNYRAQTAWQDSLTKLID